jgi:hypothetical protein
MMFSTQETIVPDDMQPRIHPRTEFTEQLRLSNLWLELIYQTKFAAIPDINWCEKSLGRIWLIALVTLKVYSIPQIARYSLLTDMALKLEPIVVCQQQLFGVTSGTAHDVIKTCQD